MFSKDDGWWKDPTMVRILAEFLVDYKNFTGKDISHFLEKPYNYSDELNEALYSGDYPEFEGDYSHLKKGGLQPGDIEVDEVR